MKKTILLLSVLFVTTSLIAQKKITLQPGYAFINGAESNASQLSFDAYYRLRVLSVGLGGAVDAHYMQSVPVYVATQKIIGKEKIRLVVYANGGMNIPALRATQKQTDFRFRGKGDYKTGYYYDFGAGFVFMLYGNKSLLLTGGYSGKSTKEMYNEGYRTGGDYIPPDHEQQHVFTYNLQRVVVRLKLQLW